MSTTAYDAFLPEVMPYLHGCPEVLALNAIRNAVIEFCEQSHWYLYTSPDIDVYTDEVEYTVLLPTDTRLALLQEAWFEDRPMEFKTPEEMGSMYQRDWRVISSAPRYITFLDPDVLQIVPSPQEDSAGGLRVIAAIAPTRSSTGADTSLFERWLEPIASGARWRLNDMPGQPFSDPAQAAKNRALFMYGISKAKIERNRGLTRGPVVARPATPW